MEEGSPPVKKKVKPSAPDKLSAELTASMDKMKPQVARKLRKERRKEKLLQKLDKESYLKSQEALEEANSVQSKVKLNRNTETAAKNTVDTNDTQGDTPSEQEHIGRRHTVSIAVAGSILDNAQTPQLKAYLAGQIARAAGIFNVDEVIVYDDTGGNSTPACELMARILQYLETPPYLRKYLFQIHQDLQYAGLIAPLDIPHHLRRTEALAYREGVVSTKPTKEGKEISYVYVGLDRECRVEKKLPEGIRVTVKFDNSSPQYILKPKGKLRGTVVSPSLPRIEAGQYWGYTVRIASSFSKIFTQSPFRDCDGYDLTIGTSDKGYPVKNFSLDETSYKHILIVFGGVEGLEYALENDESLMEDDVSVLFDHYINTCANQGSRTIRTEEALLISMTTLAPTIGKCR